MGRSLAFCALLSFAPVLTACDRADTGHDWMAGIDVSHFQGDIDWRAVKTDGVQFAYIKASEGITITDPKLVANWGGAHTNDIIIGGYHLFTPDDNGVKQAENYLNSIHSVTSSYSGRLRPVLDIESIPKAQLSRALPHIKEWLDTVESALQCRPLIYTSPDSWDREFPGDFTKYELWLADYSPSPTLPDGWRQWAFWQHTDKGKISGITKDVDLDFYNGNRHDLQSVTCT